MDPFICRIMLILVINWWMLSYYDIICNVTEEGYIVRMTPPSSPRQDINLMIFLFYSFVYYVLNILIYNANVSLPFLTLFMQVRLHQKL